MDETRKPRLIIFYRNPVWGKVKTRLARDVGNEKALRIYHKLAEHTQRATETFKGERFVYYSERIEAADVWPEGTYHKAVQRGDGLGERMHCAFEDAFTDGCEQVCIIGTDCLDMTSEIIDVAFQSLAHNDVVIGPAQDGGYYLLGLKQLHSAFFKDKIWGSDTVFDATMDDVTALHLSCGVLPVLRDIDREEDLPDNWATVL